MTVTDESPLEARAATTAELRARVLAERTGEPFVVYRDASGGQRVVILSAGRDRVTIGRGPANTIPLGWDTDVSRLHAELERFGGGWTVVEEGSSRGGTFVNGERVAGRVRLRDGDTLQVGRTRIAFRVPDPRASRKAAAAGRPATPELTPAQRRVLVALCRPYGESQFAVPASNTQIAEELFLSTDAVRAHLRALFTAFGLDALPAGRKRSALARQAMQSGLITLRDL